MPVDLTELRRLLERAGHGPLPSATRTALLDLLDDLEHLRADSAELKALKGTWIGLDEARANGRADALLAYGAELEAARAEVVRLRAVLEQIAIGCGDRFEPCDSCTFVEQAREALAQAPAQPQAPTPQVDWRAVAEGLASALRGSMGPQDLTRQANASPALNAFDAALAAERGGK
jgi:hypothetical protein